MTKDIRFRGIAAQNSDLGDLLRDWIGTDAKIEGNDWIIPSTDEVFRRGPGSVLKVGNQLPINEASYSLVAKKLASSLPTVFRKYTQEDQHLKIKYDEDTRSSRVYSAQVELTTCQYDDAKRVLGHVVLPVMHSDIGATHVTPVVADSHKFQAYISITKTLYFLENNDRERAAELIRDQSAFTGILPTSLSPLSYLDALTRFSPFAFTLSLQKYDCSFHFQGSNMFKFDHISLVGLFDHFLSDTSPMSNTPDSYGLIGLQDMTNSNIWTYLRIATGTINNLVAYVLDWRNFYNDDRDKYNFIQQIQSIGCLNLIYTDAFSMNNSTNSYHRTSFAMSALDKISNFVSGLIGDSRLEPKIFGLLFNNQTHDLLAQIISAEFGKHNDQIRDSFLVVLRNTFLEIREHYRKEIGNQVSDNEISRRVRLQRNTRHRSFLNKGLFEEIFSSSSGNVPPEVATLPFIILLTMGLNPEGFLENIRSQLA